MTFCIVLLWFLLKKHVFLHESLFYLKIHHANYIRQKLGYNNNNTSTFISWKNFLKIQLSTSKYIGWLYLNLVNFFKLHFPHQIRSIVSQLFQKIFCRKFFYRLNVAKTVRNFYMPKLFIPYLLFYIIHDCILLVQYG